MKSAEQLKQDLTIDVALRGHPMRFATTWGLFSPRGIDDGSYLLLSNIDIRDGDHVLDVGCGYGPLGLALAKDTPAGRVDLVDKDFVAVEYARRNAEGNGLANTRAYLSNGLSAVGDARFDTIVSNLPANVGRELLYILLSDAHDHLNPGGQLVVVTIAGLREFIKRNFREVFGNYKKVKQGKAHAVQRAVKNPG
jgi:16S rRNA G1207 methylase RsmC